MKSSLRTNAIASALLLIFGAGVVFTLNRVDRVREHATLRNVLYISSSKVIKRLSLGYTGLMADIYWTRAVQYFGEQHHQGAEDYKLLAPLLDITTDLDPKLVIAYRYGSTFLSPPPPNGAGSREQALALVQKGIRANPHEWTLYYDLGFIYYFDFHDYANAAQAFDQAAQQPNAHPFTKIVAASMAQHAGELGMARMLWTTVLEGTTDPDIKRNAIAHLRALVVDETVPELQRRIQDYQRRTGRLPSDFGDLIRAGLLYKVPVDPLGLPYRIAPDGQVEVGDPDSLPFITEGIPLGYRPGPPKLKDINPNQPVAPSAPTIG